MKPRPGGLVYSTDAGRMCPTCRMPTAECRCRQAALPAAGDGIVRVSRETKGRAGKGVTVIRGLVLDAAGLADIARQLKALCGSGGTVKGADIEIQGDHCERVAARLRHDGWTVKQAGGQVLRTG